MIVADPPCGTFEIALPTERNGADCDPDAESEPDLDTNNFVPDTDPNEYDTGNRAPTEPAGTGAGTGAGAGAGLTAVCDPVPGAFTGVCDPCSLPDRLLMRNLAVFFARHPRHARAFKRQTPGRPATKPRSTRRPELVRVFFARFQRPEDFNCSLTGLFAGPVTLIARRALLGLRALRAFFQPITLVGRVRRRLCTTVGLLAELRDEAVPPAGAWAPALAFTAEAGVAAPGGSMRAIAAVIATIEARPSRFMLSSYRSGQPATGITTSRP